MTGGSDDIMIATAFDRFASSDLATAGFCFSTASPSFLAATFCENIASNSSTLKGGSLTPSQKSFGFGSCFSGFSFSPRGDSPG